MGLFIERIQTKIKASHIETISISVHHFSLVRNLYVFYLYGSESI